MKNPFSRIPNHVGIIPDGNRRWAVAHSMHKKDGYAHGIGPGLRLVAQLLDMGIEEATFYGFTMDNTRRAPDQVEAFSCACIESVRVLEEHYGNDVSLMVVGNSDSRFFPKALDPYVKPDLDERAQKKLRLNFLVNYDWRWDICQAQGEGHRPEEAIASRHISRIDMVLRWGGRCRLSGFLPVQSVYADIFTIQDHWPDFDEKHLLQALEWYQTCDPTLGG